MRLIDATTLKAEFTGNFRDEYPTAMIKAIIDTAPTVGGWIRVEDRLPEQSGEVFVYTGNHHTASVSYSKKYNAFNWFDVLGEVRERDGGALWNVKYWMPIPPLPYPPGGPA